MDAVGQLLVAVNKWMKERTILQCIEKNDTKLKGYFFLT
jgi:hypothetical protein